MEKKNLRKTSGMPLYFGLAAGVLLLIGTILQSGVTTAYTNAVLASSGMSVGQTPILIGTIIGFVIYPGIFLILLILGMNKPKRGSAFPVVWIVFSAISILSGLYNLLATSAQSIQLKEMANQLVPGGFYLYSLLSLLGCICMMISCIALMKRLHQPEETQTPNAVNQ